MTRSNRVIRLPLEAARWLVLLALTIGFLFTPAQAERRVALVIGNSAYEHTSKLKNPGNDAAAVSGVLKRLGFEVLEGTDLDEPALRRIVRKFAVEMEGAEAALFFYAGHGLQVGGKNYLLPVTAKLDRELDLEFETVPLDLIMTQMERGQRTNIVLLDACRNNPLMEDLARSMGTRSATVGRGLARVETGVGTYVGFSTQPGNVALDGEGDNSPFAAALIRNIETPGLEIETLMRKVREDVIRSTGGRQVPWGNSSLVGAGFVFKAALAQDAQESGGERKTASTDQANIEIAYWNSIKDSTDPQLFEAYLAEYPSGRFARLADIMIENLTARQQATGPASRDRPEASAVETVSEAAAEPQTLAAIEPKRAEPDEPATAPPARDEEAALFDAAKSARDSSLLETYLKRFPKGRFVKEAKKLAAGIKRKQAAIPPAAASDARQDTKKRPEPTVRAKDKKKSEPVSKRVKQKEKKVKPVAAAVAKQKPVATPQPVRDQCGWCGLGAGLNDMQVCGEKFRQLQARGRCGPS